MGCLVEEDLDFRLKVNKVLGNKSFIAFLSHSDFRSKAKLCINSSPCHTSDF